MHRATPLFLLSLAAMLSSASPSGAASEQTLRFTLTGVDAERGGTVLCALYDSEDSFLTEEVVATTRARRRGGQLECVFEGLPAGIYATTALHDEDDDEEVDTAFGFPTEGYAISRDAHFANLIPQWERARFRFKGNDAQMKARMKY